MASVRAEDAPFLVGYDEGPTSFGNRWALRINAEAYRRLGLPYRPVHLPTARRAAMLDEGSIDADVARVREYGDSHPKLVRVEESIVEFGFSLYAARPITGLRHVDDLAKLPLSVEYRRGIAYCESRLGTAVPASRLSQVMTEAQGLRKLAAGRTDLYCGLDYMVQQALHLPELGDLKGIAPALAFGTLPTFTYLHPRHAELAPRLAQVLKQLKAEGLIETYRQEALREMGWTR